MMASILQPGIRSQRPDPMRIDLSLLYGAAFCCASLAFCLKSVLASRLGMAVDAVAILGNATCGWSWLATRSLFRRESPSRGDWWPVAAVLMVMIASAVTSLVPADGMPLRILDNLARLGSSAMLLMAVAEPLLDLREQSDKSERRFRILYSGIYAAILAVAVLAVDGAPDGSAASQFSIPVGTVRISVCGRAVEHYAAMALMKRSPKMTANWALAMDHSRGGIFHSFSDRFKIR